MKKYNVQLAARDVALCALFVALMTAGAYIKIPLPPVPLTFQTVIAVLSGLLLGWEKGMLSMTAYAILGLIGIPVFASGGAGIFYVLKPSFGYIIGFIASAGVAGVYEKADKKAWQYILLALAAMVADYVVGIAYFIAVWQLSGYEGLWSAVVSYNLIYIPKDVVLCVLAGVLATMVAPVLKKSGRKSSSAKKIHTADR